MDEPKKGITYAITGTLKDKCLSNGNSWDESIVTAEPFLDRDSAMTALLEEIEQSKVFKIILHQIGITKVLDNLHSVITIFVKKLNILNTVKLSKKEATALKKIYMGGITKAEEQRAFIYIADMIENLKA